MPPRDGNEWNRLRVIADFFDKGGCLLHDFIEPVLTPLERRLMIDIRSILSIDTHLGCVHFVHCDDQLADTQSKGQEGVLAGLTILGNASLKFTSTTSDDEDGTVRLGGTSNHVFDKVTVTGGINDLRSQISDLTRDKDKDTHSDHVLGGLELPEGDIDGDTTLALGLQFVEHPS